MKQMKAEQQTQSEVEINCKRLIRQYKGHCEAADRVKAELTTYANENNVSERELIQWFIDEGSSYLTAYQYAKGIIKVVREASPRVKKGLAEGLVTFKDARESVTTPTKSETQKESTLWFRDLRNSIKRAIANGVSKKLYISEVNRVYDFYAPDEPSTKDQ